MSKIYIHIQCCSTTVERKKKGEEHHLANLFNGKWLRKQMPKGFLTLDEQMEKIRWSLTARINFDYS